MLLHPVSGLYCLVPVLHPDRTEAEVALHRAPLSDTFIFGRGHHWWIAPVLSSPMVMLADLRRCELRTPSLVVTVIIL